jgi:hypothetical protein
MKLKKKPHKDRTLRTKLGEWVMEHLVTSVRIKTFDLRHDLKVILVQAWTGAEGSR